jgi:FtsH-binding integral membrane protein
VIEPQTTMDLGRRRLQAKMANGAKPKLLTVSAALFIPTVASVLFNLLNFIIENANKPNRPSIPAAMFDVSISCAFVLVGLSIGSQNKEQAQAIFIVFLYLFLMSIILVVVAPFFLPDLRLYLILLASLISLIVVGRMIWKN